MNDRPSALAMPTGGALASIVPRNLDEVARLARMAVMGGILKPIHWKRRVKDPDTGRWTDEEGEEDIDTVLARGSMIIMQGLEVGVPPMQALQLMAMINGRIAAHSELVPGILWAHGFDIEQSFTGDPMSDEWTAHCKITRPNGKTVERSFSVAQAKRAGLWSPNAKITRKGRDGEYTVDNDSPWHRYPDRMLSARALGFAAKDGGSDAMRGMMLREEAEDIVRMREARDVTPQTQVAVEPPDPDASEVPSVPSPEPAVEPVVEMPPDIPQYLVALSDAMELAGDDADLIAEVRESNASIVEALPTAERKTARRILKMET